MIPRRIAFAILASMLAGGSGQAASALSAGGDVFTGFQSTDGATWTQLGPATTIAMPTTFAVGLGVTSHADGTLATGTFDNVTITTP